MMKSKIIQTLKFPLLIFFLISAFSIYPVCMVSMQHDAMMATSQMIGSVDKAQAQSPDTCFGYHTSLFQSFTEVPSQHLAMQFIIIFLTVLNLTAFGLFALASILEAYYSRLRIRFREFYQNTILVFFTQLGFWLTLFEKRDPSYAFALA